MRLGKRLALVFAVLFLGAIETSPAQSEFRFPLSHEPTSLDWSYKRAFYEITALVNIMEGLVEINESFEVSPALAERWEVSQDRRTYIFHIRRTATWSDGKKLSARDFVYAWKRLLQPSTKSEYAGYLDEIEGAEAFRLGRSKSFASVGVKALDDSRLQLRLARGNPSFIQKLRHYVTFPQRPDLRLTIGPYRLARWRKGKEMLFERNPTYWGPAPRVPAVRALFVPDAAERRALLEKGAIDLYFNPNTAEIVKFTTAPNSRFSLKQFNALNVTLLALKTNSLDDLELRQAIAHSIDRARVPGMLDTGKIAADSLIPRGMLFYEPAALPFDVAKARRLLVGKTPLRLKLGFRRNLHEELAEYVRDSLKRVLSLDVTLVALPSSDYLNRLTRSNVDLYIDQWWPDDPDPSNFVKRMTDGSGFNRTGWSNREFNQLVEEGQNTANAIDRMKLYAKAIGLLLREQAVLVPLFHAKTSVLVSNRVASFELSPMLNDLYFKQITLNVSP